MAGTYQLATLEDGREGDKDNKESRHGPVHGLVMECVELGKWLVSEDTRDKTRTTARRMRAVPPIAAHTIASQAVVREGPQHITYRGFPHDDGHRTGDAPCAAATSQQGARGHKT